MTALEVERLSIAFGGVRAVSDVSLSVPFGLVFSIIGPNGAGKTTLLNLISGVYAPQDGYVWLGGEDVTGLAPHLLARRGLSRTFQNLQLFLRMTVLGNVMVGRHRHESTGTLSDLLHLPSVGRQNRQTREAARSVLARVGLAGHVDRSAGSLAFGDLRRLEIAAPLPVNRKCCCSMSLPPAAIQWRPSNSTASSDPSSRMASPWCWWSTTCGW